MCQNFLLACELYYTEFPMTTSVQKISFLIQMLTGRAQDWTAAVGQQGRATMLNYAAFGILCGVRPPGPQTVQQPMTPPLRQGDNSTGTTLSTSASWLPTAVGIDRHYCSTSDTGYVQSCRKSSPAGIQIST